MSRFTSHLGLQLYEDPEGRPILRGGRCQWFLREPLVYEIGAARSAETITVPACDPTGLSSLELVGRLMTGTAFLTDLASIPRLVSGLLPPDGAWAKAAVVHDLLYATRGLGGRYSRQQSDQILREAMGVLGVPGWKRELIFRAVRIGGAANWGS